MYIFGELPSDLDQMEESLGPPPRWFRPEQGFTAQQSYYYPAYAGLGERESEIEVNPVEMLTDLKFQQEMNKNIPKIANRYTTIDPMSPLFRDRKAKFGFGDFGRTLSTKDKFMGVIAVIGLISTAFVIKGRFFS